MSFGPGSRSRASLLPWQERVLIAFLFVVVLGLGYVIGVLISCATHHGCPR